jgi:hypothetical protein
MSGFFLQLWFWSSVVALLGFLVCRFRPWLALFVVPTAALFPWFFALSVLRTAPAPGTEVRQHAAIITAMILGALFIGLYLGKFKIAYFGLYGEQSTPRKEKS